MTEEQIKLLLGKSIHPLWLKADLRVLQPLIDKFLIKEGELENDDVDIRSLVVFITHEISLTLQHINDLRLRHTEFLRRYARAVSNSERKQYILDYAKYLGATNDQLDEDEQAFERWFGADAMTDRHTRKYSQAEREIALYLQQLGQLIAIVLNQEGKIIGYDILWKQLSLESTIKPLLAYDGDNRVKISAFQCLSKALRVLPEELQYEVVDVATTQYIYRSALESRQPTWIQCEALTLLQSLSIESFGKVLEKRLSNPLAGDDLFVRRRAVSLLGNKLTVWPILAQQFPNIAKDPSPFVRQEFASALRNANREDQLNWFRHLVISDESPQVRAATLLEFINHLDQADLLFLLLEIIIDVLNKEQEPFVLRVALKVVCDGQEKLALGVALKWQQKLQPSIAKLHTSASSLSVRRWAAQAREKLWLKSLPEASVLAELLQQQLQEIPPGENCRLPKSVNAVDEYLLGRVLSVLGQHDFGYDVSYGLFGVRNVTRGHKFGFRLWRFLYELRHSAPDKRQAFQHTIGRLFVGELRVPSTILSELSETKVPGEPLYISSESGWRPYLPLVDEVVSSITLGRGKTVRLFTSEGVTELTPPSSVIHRIKAWIILVIKFSQFAHLRNWQETSKSDPSNYIQALNNIGFKVTFVAHKNDAEMFSEDPAVRRFFPTVGLI